MAILGLARVELPAAGGDARRRSSWRCSRGSRPRRACCSSRRSSPRTPGCWPSPCTSPAVSLSQTWWKGPNAGQFVVTIGGYHPRFHHDGYPVVPRVGLSWSPIDDISIIGGVYFALCSEAIMAGVGLQVAAHLGPAHATLSFGGDAIVFFDPFWFQVDVYAEAEVGITDLAAVRQRRPRRSPRFRRHGRGPADLRRGALQRVRHRRSRSSSATRPTRPTRRWTARRSRPSTCAATRTPRCCRPRCCAAG